MTKKLSAVLLALFVGGLGLHRLYLNQVGLFILYLLLAITGISAFIALIDAVIWIFMDNDMFNEKYFPEKKHID